MKTYLTVPLSIPPGIYGRTINDAQGIKNNDQEQNENGQK